MRARGRRLGLALSALALGCNTLLGLDPGKTEPPDGAGSGCATVTAATGTGGGSGGSPCTAVNTGGTPVPPGDAAACRAVVWAQSFGDPATTHARVTSMAVDAQGAVVIAGYFGPSVYIGQALEAAGPFDFFLAKLDAGGVAQWSKRFGGMGNDVVTFPIQVAVGEGGTIALAGAIDGAIDFGGGFLYPAANQTDFDVFVVKLDGQGNHRWSKRFGSAPSPQIATRVALDPKGSVVLAGWFEGKLDLGGGPLSSPATTTKNGFVGKLDGASGAHVWSRGLDSPLSADVGALAADATGDLLVAGSFGGSVDLGATALHGNGFYAARFDALGTAAWGQVGASNGMASVTGAALDPAGNTLVNGRFSGTLQLGAIPALSAEAAPTDYLVKLDPTGAPTWGVTLPTTLLAVDSGGDSVVAGSFSGTVDLGGELVSAGGTDILLARLDRSGSLLWSRRFGDAANQTATAVATVPGSNRIVLAASGAGTVDFGNGALQSNGTATIFMVMLEP